MPEITIDGFEEVSVGGQRLDPGKYTFLISERPEVKDLDLSKPMSEQKPYLNVHLKVIEGPVQEEVNTSGTNNPQGMIQVQRFYLNAKWTIKRLLIACGLLARDDNDSPVAKGRFNTDMLYNCKFEGIVKSEIYEGKERRNVEPVV